MVSFKLLVPLPALAPYWIAPFPVSSLTSFWQNRRYSLTRCPACFSSEGNNVNEIKTKGCKTRITGATLNLSKSDTTHQMRTKTESLQSTGILLGTAADFMQLRNHFYYLHEVIKNVIRLLCYFLFLCDLCWCIVGRIRW